MAKIIGITVGTPIKPKSQAGGLTAEQINALDGMFKKCAYTGDVSTEYEAFKTAFGIGEGGGTDEPDTPTEATLTSISATYSGGDVVVGTSVNALTGITVKANYSDGTSKTVSGYTLSGTIAEGNNTITVSYQGKTTTFTVIGYVEEEPDVQSDNLIVLSECTDGEKMDNGAVVTTGKYLVTPFIEVTPSTDYKTNLSRNLSDGTVDWGQGMYMYDETKKYINVKSISGGTAYGEMSTLSTNENVKYVRIMFHVLNDAPYFGLSGVN